jgi:hypothetical protein
METFLSENKLFFVESGTNPDDTVLDNTVLVALRVNFNESSKLLTWWDSNKERSMIANDLVINNENLSFTSELGNRYTFTPMTMEIYENKVKDKIVTGDKNVTTMEELLEGFEKTVI